MMQTLPPEGHVNHGRTRDGKIPATTGGVPTLLNYSNFLIMTLSLII